jgi:hypothetical protein
LLTSIVNVSVDTEFSVLGDEFGEVFDGAVALVFNGFVFVVGGVEFYGWETGDFVGDVVGGGVDFGDGDGGVGVEGC